MWLVIGAVVVAAALALGWVGKPAIPASSPSSTVTPTLAAKMRALAGQLDPARDGARATDLAAGLRRVAADLDAQAPTTTGDATGLIVSTGAWNRAGQLREAVTVAALDLLRQVPGVNAQAGTTPATRAPAAAAPTTAAPTTAATTLPPTTEAPATTAPRRNNNNGDTTTISPLTAAAGNGEGSGKGKKED
jgi:hypothetical protein